MRLSPTKLLAVTGALASMLVASGCGGGGEANVANGREAFIAQCAECHILAEARSAGRIGPDLDAAFAAAREAGMNDATIEGIVASQIANPRFTDPEDPSYMPPNLVEGEDLEDVAAYVGEVAGSPDVEPLQAGDDPGEQVFVEQGCAACHSFAAAGAGGRVGPNLDTSLLGQSRGQILESIVRPNAEIARGFPAGIMPELYGSDITESDLEALVEYLIANTTPAAGTTDVRQDAGGDDAGSGGGQGQGEDGSGG